MLFSIKDKVKTGVLTVVHMPIGEGKNVIVNSMSAFSLQPHTSYTLHQTCHCASIEISDSAWDV